MDGLCSDRKAGLALLSVEEKVTGEADGEETAMGVVIAYRLAGRRERGISY